MQDMKAKFQYQEMLRDLHEHQRLQQNIGMNNQTMDNNYNITKEGHQGQEYISPQL